jgi:hypothetical protein
MTRIASTPPAFCASCFTVREGDRFVDFEAAYDGPVLIGEEDHNGNRPMKPIDDLVLCERCVNEAARLLDIGGDNPEIERLEGIIEILGQSDEAKDRMIQRLTMTLEELVDHPIQRRDGAGNFAGVPEDVSAFLKERREQRNTRSRRAKLGMKKREEEKVGADA